MCWHVLHKQCVYWYGSMYWLVLFSNTTKYRSNAHQIYTIVHAEMDPQAERPWNTYIYILCAGQNMLIHTNTHNTYKHRLILTNFCLSWVWWVRLCYQWRGSSLSSSPLCTWRHWWTTWNGMPWHGEGLWPLRPRPYFSELALQSLLCLSWTECIGLFDCPWTLHD